MATSINTPCDVCAGQSISKQAVKWCPECEEAYCSECLKPHSITNATKAHPVIAIENVSKLFSFVSETKLHCEKHESRFQNYCRSHDIPCCKLCIDTDHKECSDLPPLDDVIQDAKSSFAFADIEERLHSLNKFFSEVILEREDNLNEIKLQSKTIEKQIKQMRIDINQHLDNLEEQILQNLSIKENHIQKDFENSFEQLKKSSYRINCLLENMEPIKKYASNLRTFLSTKKIDRELYKTEREVEVLCEDDRMKRYDISFIKDDKLKNVIKDLKTFGDVSSKYELTKIIHAKSTVKQAQIVAEPYKLVENMNLVLEKKIVVSSPVSSGFVAGCVVLKNKNFLFSYWDSKNESCLIFLNEHDSEIFYLRLNNFGIKPYDIAVIDDTTVAITSGSHSKSILILDTNTRKVSKVIKTKNNCYGISFFKNTLIYSCREEGIKIRSLDKENVNTYEFGRHTASEYVAVFKNRIYSTDSSENIVTCYDMEGKVQWRCQNHDEIRGMRGVAVDNNSNVYVVGVDSGRIGIISADGQNFKSFQPKGIRNPRTIYYDKGTNKILICEKNGDSGIFFVPKVTKITYM